MKKTITALLLISLSIIIFGCKSSTTEPPTGTTKINANGSLTQVSKTQLQGTMFVTDQDNAPITGLTASNVSASLNWTADASVTGTVIVQTGTGSGKNIAAATTMDYSGSMGSSQITCMQNGVKAYITAMKTNDITEIIKFDTQIIIAQTFTSDKNLLTHAVDSVFSLGGSTALYSSIYQATNDAAAQNSSQYIRCVVAFTDGGENSSTITRNDMITNALNNGIPVYTIGLLDFYSGQSTPGQDLKNIADTTGGFYFRIPPDTCGGLTNIYNTINGQLNGAYSITINWPSSGLPATGTSVTVIVTINYNNLTASFQKTYIIM